jgi:hypothetical protein
LQEEKQAPDEAPTLTDFDNAPDVVPMTETDAQLTNSDYIEKLAEVSESKEKLAERAASDASQILNDLIKPYADKAFNFMRIYCGSVLLLLLMDGFSLCGFNLPDTTLDFLVSSTAVTVIGLVGMVLTGIFIGARK